MSNDEFQLLPPKRPFRSWRPEATGTAKQMQMFVGVNDAPNQGLLFGELTIESQAFRQDDEKCESRKSS